MCADFESISKSSFFFCKIHEIRRKKEQRLGLWLAAYRDRDNGIGDEQLLFPMQDQAAWEMPACLDSGHSRQDSLFNTGQTMDESQRLRRRRLPAEPFLVICGHINGTVESLRPIRVGGVVMWMGDDDGFYAAL